MIILVLRTTQGNIVVGEITYPSIWDGYGGTFPRVELSSYFVNRGTLLQFPPYISPIIPHESTVLPKIEYIVSLKYTDFVGGITLGSETTLPVMLCTTKHPTAGNILFFVEQDGNSYYTPVMHYKSPTSSFHNFPVWSELALAYDSIKAWASRPIPNTGGGGNSPDSENSTGGGNGDFDNESDLLEPTPISTLANANVISAGFISAYLPTLDQLKDISKWIGSFWESLIAVVPGQDPLKYIVGVHTIPLPRDTIPKVDAHFTFGFRAVIPNTSPECPAATGRFVNYALGTVDLTPYSDTFADYSPYTNYSIYLPYIGTKQLSADVIAGKSLGVKYTFDIVTGSCCAYIVDNTDGNVLYHFVGSAASSLPFTTEQAGSFYLSLATMVGALGDAGISGVMSYRSARSVADKMDSAKTQAILQAPLRDITDPSLSNAVKMPDGESKWASAGKGISSGAHSGSRSALTGPVASSMLSKSGILGDANIGGSLGLIGYQTCYLIRTRPRDSYPPDYQSVIGYPSNTSQMIGNYTGFNVFSGFHLEGIPALPEELDEIEALLQGGIIL